MIKRILIDLDSTVVDLLTHWIAENNKRFDDDLTVDKVTSWDMHSVSKGGLDTYKILEGMPFADLAPYAGAIDGVKALHDAGHEIFVVTAAAIPANMGLKGEWYARFLPFLPKRNLIITHAKEAIKADVLIDDSPANATAYRKAHPAAHILAIRFPYNVDCKAYNLLAGSHAAPDGAWLSFVKYVEDLGRRDAELKNSWWSDVFTPQTYCAKHVGERLKLRDGYLTCSGCVGS